MLPRNLLETPAVLSNGNKLLQDGSLAALLGTGVGAERRAQGNNGLSKKMVMLEMIRANTAGCSQGQHQLQMPVKVSPFFS
jgi:hypothetical protein